MSSSQLREVARAERQREIEEMRAQVCIFMKVDLLGLIVLPGSTERA